MGNFFSDFRIFQIFLEKCKCKSIVWSAWLFELKLISKHTGTFRLGIVRGQMGIIFDFDLYEFCTDFSERFTSCILSRFVRIFLNLNALLRVCYLDLYEFDLYDLFGERFSRTNRGIAVINFWKLSRLFLVYSQFKQLYHLIFPTIFLKKAISLIQDRFWVIFAKKCNFFQTIF